MSASQVLLDTAHRLQARAEVWWQDGTILTQDGDKALGAAYRALANELRRVADELVRASAGVPL